MSSRNQDMEQPSSGTHQAHRKRRADIGGGGALASCAMASPVFITRDVSLVAFSTLPLTCSVYRGVSGICNTCRSARADVAR